MSSREKRSGDESLGPTVSVPFHDHSAVHAVLSVYIEYEEIWHNTPTSEKWSS